MIGDTSGEQSRRLFRFVVGVDLLAIAAIGCVAALSHTALPERPGILLLLLAGVAALAGARSVLFPVLRYRLTAVHPLVFCAIVLLGPLAAAAVDVAGVAAAALARRSPERKLRVAFNAGSVVLSTAAAALAFGVAGGQGGSDGMALIGPLLAAAVGYVVVNTGLVARVICLEQDRRFVPTWREAFGWTVPGDLTGAIAALGLVLLVRHAGPYALLAALLPCWHLADYYRACHGLRQERRLRLEQVAQFEAGRAATREALERSAELQASLSDTRRRLNDAYDRLALRAVAGSHLP